MEAGAPGGLALEPDHATHVVQLLLPIRPLRVVADGPLRHLVQKTEPCSAVDRSTCESCSCESVGLRPPVHVKHVHVNHVHVIMVVDRRFM